MMDIERYDYIRMSDADNGVKVSFDIMTKSENKHSSFENMGNYNREYVFTLDKLDEAFALFKALTMYNITKRKGETVQPVTLPS